MRTKYFGIIKLYFIWREKMWENFHSTCFFSHLNFIPLFIAWLQHHKKSTGCPPLPVKRVYYTSKIYWARKQQANLWNITWKKSSVETPNHSGESKNWCWNTMCRALWFCDTTSLFVGKENENVREEKTKFSKTKQTKWQEKRRCEMLERQKCQIWRAAFAKRNN